jgi:hypothetical protein
MLELMTFVHSIDIAKIELLLLLLAEAEAEALMFREEQTSTSVLSGMTLTGRPPPASGPTPIVIVSEKDPFDEDSYVMEPQFSTVASELINVSEIIALLYTFAPGSMTEFEIIVFEWIPGLSRDLGLLILVLSCVVVCRRSRPNTTYPEKVLRFT